MKYLDEVVVELTLVLNNYTKYKGNLSLMRGANESDINTKMHLHCCNVLVQPSKQFPSQIMNKTSRNSAMKCISLDFCFTMRK